MQPVQLHDHQKLLLDVLQLLKIAFLITQKGAGKGYQVRTPVFGTFS
jgi:phosphomevalonate kinase